MFCRFVFCPGRGPSWSWGLTARLVTLLALTGSAARAAQPTPSILVVPATPGARSLCEQVLEVFAGENVRVKLAGEKSESVGCMKQPAAERKACLVDALTDAKVDATVLVTATAKGAQGVAGFELLSRVGESERQETVKAAKAKLQGASKAAIVRIVQTLRAVLLIEETRHKEPPVASPPPPVEPAPRPPPDAPVAELKLLPTPPVPVTALAQVEKPRGAAWVMTTVAILGAGAAGTVSALGFMDQARLQQTRGGISELSYGQATALRGQTNTEFTVALSAGITAGVAAIVAGVLWAQ